MIDPRYYGLVELVLVMGLVLGFAFFQLRELKRLERERERESGRQQDEPGPDQP